MRAGLGGAITFASIGIVVGSPFYAVMVLPLGLYILWAR